MFQMSHSNKVISHKYEHLLWYSDSQNNISLSLTAQKVYSLYVTAIKFKEEKQLIY